MLIVLIRHGIAEDISAGKKDSLRNLTSEGIEKFTGEVPGLLLLLNAQGDTQIWHSPTNRTTQTAKILHRSIPESALKEKNFIAESDFNKFTEALKNTNLPDVLVIVGHEPGMSMWSRKIASVSIKFSKGACAGFIVKDIDTLTGKLEWFLKPSALIRIGGK